MSTTTSSDVLAAHARGYAEAVRLHLADLAPDVVDDLTDGLEADLTDALLDDVATVPPGGIEQAGTRPLDLATRFGPAADYALELRTAAGLPVADPARDGRRRATRAVAGAWSVAAERWRDFWRPMTAGPAWGALIGFLRSLAPAWWVLRGWVGAQVVLWPFGMSDIVLWPSTTAGRVAVVAAVVVSVQWGRGLWLPRRRWAPRALAVASVAAGILAIPMVADVEADAHRPLTSNSYDSAYDSGWNDGYGSAQMSVVSDGGAPSSDGVWVDGMQVSNLFAYDAQGDPIRDVQLFDDRGRPVRTIGGDATWDTWAVPDVAGSWSFQPAISSDGRTRWNVFPLRAVPAEQVGLGDSDVSGYSGTGDEEYPVPPTGVQPEEMPWPFLKAPTAIAGTEPGGSGDGPADVDEEGSAGSGAGAAGEDGAAGGSRNAPSGDVEPLDEQADERPATGGTADVVRTLEATRAD